MAGKDEDLKMESEQNIEDITLSFVGLDSDKGVIDVGGPWHTRGYLQMYLDYYQKINKPEIAERMKEKYSNIKGYNK